MSLEKRSSYLPDLVHGDHPLEPFSANTGQQKGTLTKRQRGRDWTRKTPLRGSLLRASSQTRALAAVKKSIYSLIDLREILFGCNRRYLAHLSALDDFSAGVRALGRLTAPRA